MIERWLGKDRDHVIRVLDPASVSEARERTREVGRSVGLEGERLERLVSAVSELATNQLAHARGGLIDVRPCTRGDAAGVEIIAADRGDGLVDPKSALAGAGRVSGSLGVGLSAVRRQADELDIDTRIHEGTCFRARKFARPIAKAREVGIYGVPKLGETTSGDDATIVRSGGALALALVDGLGHGPRARDASWLLVDGIGANPWGDFEHLLHELDERARETRGAAVTIVRIDEALRTASCAAVGNVSAFVQTGKATRHFGGSSWTVGGKHRMNRAVRPEKIELAPGSAVIVFTDGVSSSVEVSAELLHEHPVVVAHAIATAYGRPQNDDVTVVVAR